MWMIHWSNTALQSLSIRKVVGTWETTRLFPVPMLHKMMAYMDNIIRPPPRERASKTHAIHAIHEGSRKVSLK